MLRVLDYGFPQSVQYLPDLIYGDYMLSFNGILGCMSFWTLDGLRC